MLGLGLGINKSGFTNKKYVLDTEVSEAEGFTPEQVQIYLNDIDGDNIVEVDTIAEYTPEWFDWE
jgi:hypothetical protein